MKLLFKTLKMKNFLSYSEETLDLQDQGCCMVKGINNCKTDNALSNGSGKSSWVSAICWCLTGQTIQGVKSNIANIFIPENECWVELNFLADCLDIRLTRYCKPKSDLKIFVNNVDKSGKGLKESEEQLALLLPDLTKELISSTILLGQRLPDKLSSLSPSGRKDMLEKLSKSDFMIQDIKKRVENRELFLSDSIRHEEDEILKINTQLELYKNRKASLDTQIQELSTYNFDEEIFELNQKLGELNIELNKLNTAIKNNEQLNENSTNILLELVQNKQSKLNQVCDKYSKESNRLKQEESNIKLNSGLLKTEIERLKNIKNTCPTCGQKLPGVFKQDTSDKELELKLLNEKANEIHIKLDEIDLCVKEEQDKVAEFYQTDINNLTTETNKRKETILSDKQLYNTLLSTKQSLEFNYNKSLINKENLIKNLTKFNEEKSTVEENINLSERLIKDAQAKKQNLEDHQSVLKKINTLIKRDFRGYLLSNIIEYIQDKAKEYSVEVFGNDNLEFKLDGNNIVILLNNKTYESLSGGEKQRVDIIIQFAIRDMLQTHLGYSSNILVLDEISDDLDALSCDKIFSLISSKLKDIESVFVISHHAESLSIPVDKELTVIKNTEGISSIIPC